MKIIDTEGLRRLKESGCPAIFDVRGDVDYEIGHIPDAKTAPLGSLVFRVARIMNPGSLVIVYSAGGDCTLAREAAERLENLGLLNVYCYNEGLAGWQAANLPVVPSARAKVHARGPIHECRSIVVNRDEAYGGAFRGDPVDVAGAGG